MTKNVSEKVYGKVDKCTLAYEDYIRQFAKKIRGARILDVGCGLGNYTSLFAKNNNVVVGLDLVDFRSKLFSKKFKFVQGDATCMPFKSHEFDVVICLDVIEHIEKDFKAAREIKRVLKAGGKILIATPNRNRLSMFLAGLISRRYSFPHVGQESGFGGKSVHVREYTERELLSLFSGAGFKNLNIDNFWFGLRGKIDVGVKRFFIKQLCQYLFLTNE